MARLGALSGEPLLPSTLFQGGCLFLDCILLHMQQVVTHHALLQLCSFFLFLFIFSCISTSFLYLCVFILYLLSFLLPSLHLPACQLWHYHTTNPDKLVAVCLLAVIQTNSSYNIFYQSCLFEKWPILSGQSFKHHETFSGYVYSLSH